MPSRKQSSYGSFRAAAVRLRFGIAALLISGVFLAYLPIIHNQFVNFDDHAYLTYNSYVQAGLNLQSLRWAFTPQLDNWHPLTWWVHILHWQILGGSPAGHHLANVAWHAAGSVLLFLALDRLVTAGRAISPSKSQPEANTVWAAGLVAALFAIHPLHVESVAWASELKDILCGLFFWLALLTYACYAQRPSWWRYFLITLCLLAGLLAKPMIVSLPIVLLLCDYWPLARYCNQGSSITRFAALVLEKLPLLSIAGAFAVITRMVQSKSASLLRDLPLAWRVANAGLAAVAYLWQTFWPFKMACIYPYPRLEFSSSDRIWIAAGASLLLLTLISVLAVALRKRSPYVLTGWFWYLATLVPVIGIVQVGRQARADRYTYVPLVGIFLIIAWGLVDLGSRLNKLGRCSCLAAVIAWLVLLGVRTSQQVRVWRDDVTLFTHAIQVTSRNAMAAQNLGSAQLLSGHPTDAIGWLRQAIDWEPDYTEAWRNLGVAFEQTSQPSAARDAYRRAYELDPKSIKSVYDLARILATSSQPSVRDPAEALRITQQALRGLSTPPAELLDIQAAAYAASGQFDRAVAVASQAKTRALAEGKQRLAAEIEQRISGYRRAAGKQSTVN